MYKCPLMRQLDHGTFRLRIRKRHAELYDIDPFNNQRMHQINRLVRMRVPSNNVGNQGFLTSRLYGINR
jgi:hypothetical protein